MWKSICFHENLIQAAVYIGFITHTTKFIFILPRVLQSNNSVINCNISFMIDCHSDFQVFRANLHCTIFQMIATTLFAIFRALVYLFHYINNCVIK